MTRDRAIALGWSVKIETVIPYDGLPMERFMIIDPSGNSDTFRNDNGAAYGNELGYETEAAAWERVKALSEDRWEF